MDVPGGVERSTSCEHIDALCAHFNGDIRVGHAQHVVDGCCVDRGETVEKIASAFEGGLLAAISTCDPSKNRWGSCAKALGLQVAGHMLHNLLNRVLRATFPRWELPEGDGEDAAEDDQDSDYRKMLRNKAWRATHSRSTPLTTLPSSRRSSCCLWQESPPWETFSELHRKPCFS